MAWFDKNAVKVTVSDERKGGGCLEFGVGKVISFLLLGLYKKNLPTSPFNKRKQE